MSLTYCKDYYILFYMDTNTQYLTVEEARNLLRISMGTMRRFMLRKDNPLPFSKLGQRVIRIDKEKLNHWLTSQEESVPDN